MHSYLNVTACNPPTRVMFSGEPIQELTLLITMRDVLYFIFGTCMVAKKMP